jgi:hypothetical protein
MNARILTSIRVAVLTFAGVAAAGAANLVVTNLNDSGPGSLREAIVTANGNGQDDLITFTASGVITLSSTLPAIRSNLTIDGAGLDIRISGDEAVRVMVVLSGNVRLQNLTMANGRPLSGGEAPTSDGGGVYNSGNLTIYRCRLLHNNAALVYGGGIASYSGTLTIIDSTLADNAGYTGGAIYSNGVLNIQGSTFADNRAFFAGAINQWTSVATISDSTFSGNNAVEGSAIQTGSSMALSNSTVFNNSSGVTGPAIQNFSTLTLSNTIIAKNGLDCANSGTIVPSGVNLVGDGSCAIPGALSGDPVLGPLADNGGPTQTHALLTSPTRSPAIDAGTNCGSKDQRGRPRPADGDANGAAACDIGAYEYVPPFPFTGFFRPVENLPSVNMVKAGQAVPISFTLGGNRGLAIFDAGYPASAAMGCASGSPVAEIVGAVTAGGSSLAYDATTGSYTYVWKTDKSWAGTCRQFVIQLIDGTIHTANFQFR